MGQVALILGPITGVVTEWVTPHLVQDIRRALAIRNAMQPDDHESLG
jgi:hypothetical protein